MFIHGESGQDLFDAEEGSDLIILAERHFLHQVNVGKQCQSCSEMDK